MITRRVTRSEIGKTRYIQQAKTRRTNPETCDSHTISYIITRRVIRSEIGTQATSKQKQKRTPEPGLWRVTHHFVLHHTPCGSTGKEIIRYIQANKRKPGQMVCAASKNMRCIPTRRVKRSQRHDGSATSNAKGQCRLC